VVAVDPVQAGHRHGGADEIRQRAVAAGRRDPVGRRLADGRPRAGPLADGQQRHVPEPVPGRRLRRAAGEHPQQVVGPVPQPFAVPCLAEGQAALDVVHHAGRGLGDRPHRELRRVHQPPRQIGEALTFGVEGAFRLYQTADQRGRPVAGVREVVG
jgi:hypothetical protein